ncbi:GntR family transcriptional regulator [Thermophilibacter provencensis]|uniref:GntR family transcriptional regulator n=1 Tax=Thermophilibacter provencensis TaxID=1852386 RepID=A0A921GG02_9ACTN|nr:GntR family transcriptional regulator [Thermophilibacter provencensis]HJF45169.1 GntR family transcriptional regulator [Thermophilibacter provencensis]
MLKYQSIASDIQRSIEAGALKPNAKLPTVVELCEAYGVSKITIKRAIDLLTDRGLISSRRGSGTYVKNTTELLEQTGLEPVDTTANSGVDSFAFSQSDRAAGFTEEHASKGKKISSVVYDFSIASPPADVARHLSIHSEDFTYHICRVRCLDDEPMVIEYTYMPLDLIPGLKRSQLYRSVYDYLQNTLGLKISSFHRIFRAVPATEKEAERLGTTPGSPMLEIAQVGFLDDGAPFEYSVSRYEGTRGEVRDINVI